MNLEPRNKLTAPVLLGIFLVALPLLYLGGGAVLGMLKGEGKYAAFDTNEKPGGGRPAARTGEGQAEPGVAQYNPMSWVRNSDRPRGRPVIPDPNPCVTKPGKGVAFNASTVRYDVEGMTEAQLLDAAKNNLPEQAKSRGADGAGWCDYTIERECRTQGPRCDCAVTVKAVNYVPRAKFAGALPPEVASLWADDEAYLVKHEDTHAYIALRQGNWLAEQLAMMAGPCDDAKIEKAARDAEEKFNASHRAFHDGGAAAACR